MAPRVHLPGPLRPGAAVELDREPSHHLCRVLRLAPGDAVQVFDGEGARHAATIDTVDARRCRIVIGDALPGPVPARLRLTLAQCVSAGEKMDWTIEKAVELGVAAIVPLLAQRGVVRLDAQRAQRRVEHWRRLVIAACMQCGQDRLPPVANPQPLSQWLRARRGAGFVLDPDARTRLAAVELADADVDLLVGPESGLSDDERAAAEAAGMSPVSIGPRVLRTETAGLAAIAVLQSRFGDL